MFQQVLPVALIVSLVLRVSQCASKFQNKKVLSGALPGSLYLNLPSMITLYEGDSIDEFLALCPNGCDSDCSLLHLNPDPDLPSFCTIEERDIVASLKDAQAQVREFRDKILEPITSSIDTMILYFMIVVAFSMGVFLICKKHFHFKTLFNKDFSDPTYGMPIWQFEQMKFTPSDVPDTRSQQVRIAELHRRLEKKNAEREALRLLRQQLREQSKEEAIISDHEQQLQLEEKEAEAAKHKQKTATVGKRKKKHHRERRLSGAMSAQFLERDDYGSLIKTRKKRMNLVEMIQESEDQKRALEVVAKAYEQKQNQEQREASDASTSGTQSQEKNQGGEKKGSATNSSVPFSNPVAEQPEEKPKQSKQDEGSGSSSDKKKDFV